MPASPAPPKWLSATLPKKGNKPEENEDAVAVSPDGLRFAVADGASEGWESGSWAAHLAAAYLAGPPMPSDFTAWLAGVRRGWSPAAAAGEVPWYASVKQEQGSFATLAGLEFRRSQHTPGWTWRSVAVGDSCLLLVRGQKIEVAFPLTAAEEFGNQPALVPSSASEECPEPQWLAGYSEPGDLFLLATDAAAARLLDSGELAPALAAVQKSLRAEDPAALLSWCRAVQAIKNDDVSVIAIRLPLTPAEERP